MKILAASLGLALLLPAPLALAQYQAPPGWGYHPYAAPPPGPVVRRAVPQGAYGVQPGPVCVPWCQADYNPCDPPVYKQADGRCFQEN